MAELPMLVAEDFWNLRFVTQMQPAPDGRSIAYTVEWNDQEANETHSAIWHCDLLTGQTRRLSWCACQMPAIRFTLVHASASAISTSFSSGSSTGYRWSPRHRKARIRYLHLLWRYVQCLADLVQAVGDDTQRVHCRGEDT